MNCEDFKIHIYDYLNGELEKTKTAAMEEHIQQCQSCKKELAVERQFERLVVKLDRKKAPMGLASNIKEQIRNEKPSRIGPKVHNIFTIPSKLRFTFEVAALVIVMITAIYVYNAYNFTKSRQSASEVTEVASQDTLTKAAEPLASTDATQGKVTPQSQPQLALSSNQVGTQTPTGNAFEAANAVKPAGNEEAAPQSTPPMQVAQAEQAAAPAESNVQATEKAKEIAKQEETQSPEETVVPSETAQPQETEKPKESAKKSEMKVAEARMEAKQQKSPKADLQTKSKEAKMVALASDTKSSEQNAPSAKIKPTPMPASPQAEKKSGQKDVALLKMKSASTAEKDTSQVRAALKLDRVEAPMPPPPPPVLNSFTITQKESRYVATSNITKAEKNLGKIVDKYKVYTNNVDSVYDSSNNISQRTYNFYVPKDKASDFTAAIEKKLHAQGEPVALEDGSVQDLSGRENAMKPNPSANGTVQGEVVNVFVHIIYKK